MGLNDAIQMTSEYLKAISYCLFIQICKVISK